MPRQAAVGPQYLPFGKGDSRCRGGLGITEVVGVGVGVEAVQYRVIEHTVVEEEEEEEEGVSWAVQHW